MIISLPEGYQGKLWLIIPPHVFLVYSLLHCQTIVQILHHFTVTVNNIQVTVNTCTCTDVFTVTTKDQSGGIYNNCSPGGQGFMAVVNKPRPLA